MGKEKKDKRSKKEKKSKKRKRDDDSSGEENGHRSHQRTEQEALRISKALSKGTEEAYADDQGRLQIGGRFVWKKKIEQELHSGTRAKDIYEREQRNTLAEREAEIEKVKRRREDREREREERDRENEQLQRDRAAAEAVELEQKEDEFHLENAKERSLQRLKEGRPRPIDFAVRDLLLGGYLDVGPHPPYHIFKNLNLSEVQDLQEDLLEFQELDSNEKVHKAWWDALLFVCQEELREAELRRQDDKARLKKTSASELWGDRDVGVHASVDASVQEHLSGQGLNDLIAMEKELKEELQSGRARDPEFNSAILKRLAPHKAKAELREIHSMLLSRQLVQGREQARGVQRSGWRDEYTHVGRQNEQAGADDSAGEAEEDSIEENRAPAPIIPQSAEASESADEDGGPGQWSPSPLEPEEYVNADVIPEEQDAELTRLLRQQALQASAASFEVATQLPVHGSGDFGNGAQPPQAQARAGTVPEGDDAQTRQFRAQAHRSMGNIDEAGDAPFGGEVQMESRVYWWHEKYRPRKPKYYNRVHTGYEWNKYNQTHYDHDNPPPKVVQGYKFNVFYPDLIDKKVAPEYSVEADPEADQFGSTCVLRFSAGPPYEDLTFRILNREWEYSHKKGYKCVFDRDTLYLYFNFKRQRYRR